MKYTHYQNPSLIQEPIKSIWFLVMVKKNLKNPLKHIKPLDKKDHHNKLSKNKTLGSDNGWTDRFLDGLLHFGQLPGRLALLLLLLFDLLLDPLPLPVLPLRLTRLLLQLISQLVNLSLIMVQLKELQLKLLLCLQYRKHKYAWEMQHVQEWYKIKSEQIIMIANVTCEPRYCIYLTKSFFPWVFQRKFYQARKIHTHVFQIVYNFEKQKK